MKKFADYFKDAIKYGESLGLRNGTEEKYADFCVELLEPKLLKSKNEEPFYPSFLTAWGGGGIDVKALSIVKPEFTLEQQIKLIKLFIAGYEQYLSGKKEPVATDSSN